MIVAEEKDEAEEDDEVEEDDEAEEDDETEEEVRWIEELGRLLWRTRTWIVYQHNCRRGLLLYVRAGYPVVVSFFSVFLLLNSSLSKRFKSLFKRFFISSLRPFIINTDL